MSKQAYVLLAMVCTVVCVLVVEYTVIVFNVVWYAAFILGPIGIAYLGGMYYNHLTSQDYNRTRTHNNKEGK